MERQVKSLTLKDQMTDSVIFSCSSSYREPCLKGKISSESANGIFIQVNRDQHELSAAFGSLKKLGHWSAPNPLAGYQHSKSQRENWRSWPRTKLNACSMPVLLLKALAC